MIEVRYEQYWNDYHNKSELEKFRDLEALEDWMFENMQQNHNIYMRFPTPKAAERIKANGPWAIEFTPTYSGACFRIHQIKNDNGDIMFSDGRCTSGQKFWNKEIQNWLIHCDERKKNPKFNFADTDDRQNEISKRNSSEPSRIRESDKAAFLGQVIEIFELFLEERGIHIDNPEKLEENDPDNACNIFGSDYGELSTDLEELFKNWEVLENAESSELKKETKKEEQNNSPKKKYKGLGR